MEKAFDRVHREVTRWALRKAGVEEWLVKALMAMYDGAQTVVKTTECRITSRICIESPTFVIVMEMISRVVQVCI